jgi:hypothetical protein
MLVGGWQGLEFRANTYWEGDCCLVPGGNVIGQGVF